jgi:hypothetical protein
MSTIANSGLDPPTAEKGNDPSAQVDRPASVAGHIQEREQQAGSADASQQGSQLDAAAGGEKGMRSHEKTNQTMG